MEDAQRRVGELERVLAEAAADYHQLQQQHAELVETLALFRRYIFGPRRERIIDEPSQGHLIELYDPALPLDATTSIEPDTSEPAEQPKTTRSRRRTSLDHLPHTRIEHALPDDEKTCSCRGGAKQRVGEDISGELEYDPAQLEVKVHVVPKYACPRCLDGVASPPVPATAIPGGIAGPGLVSYVLVSKFADHRVQGEAVHEMRGGLSRSGCRTRPQTAGVLRRSRAVVVSDSGNGATRSRQVRAGKTSESEPSMTCRKCRSGSKPGSGGCPGISTCGACRRTV